MAGVNDGPMTEGDPATGTGSDGEGETHSSGVDVDRVGKTYASDGSPVRALDDVSFAVEKGEFVCLVGPSGCGKTTLFRIIAGLTDATDGEVRLGGTPITGPTTDMGVVFQEYHLFPWLTVE